MFTYGFTDWKKCAPLDLQKSTLERGSKLGDYRVLEALHATFLDVTYLAEHGPSGRSVTIVEYLPTGYSRRTDGRVRWLYREFEDNFSIGRGWFRDAARVLHDIDHPCLPRVPAYFDANGTTYMVIEPEAGESLDIIRKRSGTLPEEQLKPIAMQIAEGLDLVHGAGILHFHIGPSQILVRERPPVLRSFQWASQKFIHAYHGMTAVTLVERAPFEYSAPKQFDSDGRHGPWTDIYSLAAICYVAMTGRTLPESVRRYVKLLRGDPDPLPSLAEDLGLAAYSRQFREAVDWGLRIVESERPANLGEWCAALAGTRRPGHLVRADRAVPVILAAPGAKLSNPRSVLPAGTRFRDGKGLPELVVIPSGHFIMGVAAAESRHRLEDPDDFDVLKSSECHPMDFINFDGPPHRVTIAYPFAVGVYAVTRYEFARFVARSGYSDANYGLDDDELLAVLHDRLDHVRDAYLKNLKSGFITQNWRRPGFSQGGSHPVTHVSWTDAQAYVAWLSRRTGEDYRLLSEAEWEYVARAGASGPIRFGPPHPVSSSKSYRVGPTVPVESMPRNAFGVHPIGGTYYREWTQDCWHDTYVGAPDDGSAWLSDVDDIYEGSRVVRAGDWRSDCNQGKRWLSATFRVARVLRT